MKKRLRQYTSLLFFVAAMLPCSYAQSILPVKHINVEDGLSQSTVYSIYQDGLGFTWFATGDGLIRYDGKDFIPYKSRYNDTFSAYPQNRNINSLLFEDSHNKIWFSTDAGLSYADTRHRRSKAVYGGSVLNNSILIAMKNDTLWLAQHNALYAVNTNTYSYVKYAFPAKSINEPASSVYTGIASGDSIWIIDNQGLLFFDKRVGQVRRVFENNSLRSGCRLANGDILLSGANGVYRYAAAIGTVTFIPTPGAGSGMVWHSIVRDTVSGTIYLSSLNKGTVYEMDVNTGKLEAFFTQASVINHLYVDRSQNLWIGTDGAGLYRIDIKPSKFHCFPTGGTKDVSAENGLLVKSIYYDEYGRFWISSFYNGLLVYDPAIGVAQKVNVPYFEKSHHPVSVIMKDSSGGIMLTVSNHILWLDPRSFKIFRHIELHVDKNYSASGPVIYTATEWKKGHFIIGTNCSFFSLVCDNGKPVYYWPRSFSATKGISGWIYNLQHASDGIIYLTRRNGFGKIQMLSDTAFKVLDVGSVKTAVRCSYKSPANDILWLAAEAGLVAYNEKTKQYRIFDENAGMGNSNVYAVLPQSDTSLWISTNGGISNMRLSYKNNDIACTHFINYTAKDGLQSDEFNANAYFKTAGGMLVFGGINGINWFYPAMIKPNPYMAKPAITAIEVNDTLFAADTAAFISTLSMPYRRNTISFSFRALEYTNPDRNKYAYKLEGLDNDWVYTTGDKVRYSNLRPGDYTFLLKVSNNEGLWNEKPLQLKLTILPPFWGTWWFRTLALAVVCMLIYFASRYYVRQKIRAKMRELEKQEALNMERIRISKDVHDDLGSGLSKITLMAELAASRKNGSTKLDETIEDISQISRDLVGNMRDLVWVLNPENTTLDSLAARMREYCSDYFENMPQSLQLHFPVDIPPVRISREAQRNIFLTVKEALNNCVKHSGAGVVKVHFYLKEHYLRISVADNGKGFNVLKATGAGNGLKNMRQRIDAIGGSFVIEQTATGTVIDISVSLEKISVKEITQ